MNIKVAILADDLTGALDCAVAFAVRGMATQVSLSQSVAPLDLDSLAVIALTLDSRHMPSEQAYVVAEEAAAFLDSWQPDLIFKKIDSRLKGNLVPETAPLINRAHASHILCAPAIPQLGRMVRDGFVTGSGVEAPISVRERFGALASQLHVPDVGTDPDLDSLARHVVRQDGPQLVIGASGLAAALARQLSARPPRPVPLFPAPSLLAIGSRDPITLQQVRHAEAAAAITVREAPNGALAISRERPTKPQLLLCIPGEERLAPEVVAEIFGASVKDQVEAIRSNSIFLSGGDTALAILRAMQVRSLVPVGELQAGIPLSIAQLGDGTDMYVITKSGGFGGSDVIRAIVTAPANAHSAARY